jgi:hypothetical protein
VLGPAILGVMKDPTAKPQLFRAIDVWERNGESELIRFRCFQSLLTGKYSVQSEDHYHVPVDPKQVSDLDKNFLELLFEQSPSERSETYNSLAEAIAAHVDSFAGFWSEGWADASDE